jgi:hypothetical protein
VRKLAYCVTLVLALAVGSCQTIDRGPLTRAQVERNLDRIDEPLSQQIDQLDLQIRKVREVVIESVIAKEISVEIAQKVLREIAIADYFMARSWSSLIERRDDAKELLDAGTDSLERAIDIAIKASKAEVERRSF